MTASSGPLEAPPQTNSRIRLQNGGESFCTCHFQANAAAVDRQAFLLSRPLGLDEQETKEKLAGMLRRHEEEWDSFVDALEPRSFVAQWIARGQ